VTAAQIVLLLGAVAGVVGSAGGTASLLAYPALLAVGIPPLPANVTISAAFVAAWPGSALGSQPELHGQGPWLWRWAWLAVGGSAAGAALLLVTPARTPARAVRIAAALAGLGLAIYLWTARGPS